MTKLFQLNQQFNHALGKGLSWLIFAMMLISCTIVLLRYGFHHASTALQELLLYLHGCVFLLGAAYTLQCDEHVRVDIFYSRFNQTQKAWVDVAGTIFFLMPFCIFLMVFGWQFFHSAWLMNEGSSEPGGLPFVYVLKGFIPLGFALLLLQALSVLLQKSLFLVLHKEL